MIDQVKKPGLEFSGLFCHQLPTRPILTCSSTKEEFILFNSVTGCYKHIYSFSLKTRQLHCLTRGGGDHSSWVLHDVSESQFICMKVSPVGHCELFLCSLENGSSIITFKRFDVGGIGEKRPSLNSVDWTVLSSSHDPLVEMIVLKPKENKGSLPLIIYPHGGPNSSFTTEFMLYPSALAMKGFLVALVNYTGSTGYGDDRIEQLEGRIGTLDVEDVQVRLLKDFK